MKKEINELHKKIVKIISNPAKSILVTNIIVKIHKADRERYAKIAENLMSESKMYYNRHIQDKIAKAIRED